MGINLGPVKLVKDINGHPNIIGDGINVAQRIMSFARPGQIVVSRSYYDVVSNLASEYAKLFHYEGSRTDKHVREHEIYVVGHHEGALQKAKDGMKDRASSTTPNARKTRARRRRLVDGDAEHPRLRPGQEEAHDRGRRARRPGDGAGRSSSSRRSPRPNAPTCAQVARRPPTEPSKTLSPAPAPASEPAKPTPSPMRKCSKPHPPPAAIPAPAPSTAKPPEGRRIEGGTEGHCQEATRTKPKAKPADAAKAEASKAEAREVRECRPPRWSSRCSPGARSS